jgi:hypothetical protein
MRGTAAQGPARDFTSRRRNPGAQIFDAEIGGWRASQAPGKGIPGACF